MQNRPYLRRLTDHEEKILARGHRRRNDYRIEGDRLVWDSNHFCEKCQVPVRSLPRHKRRHHG